MGTRAVILIIDDLELEKKNIDYRIVRADDIYDKFKECQDPGIVLWRHWDGFSKVITKNIRDTIKQIQVAGSAMSQFEFHVPHVAANLIAASFGTYGGVDGEQRGPYPTWIPLDIYFYREDLPNRDNIDGSRWVLILDKKQQIYVLKRTYYDLHDSTIHDYIIDLLKVEHGPLRLTEITTREEYEKMVKREREKLFKQVEDEKIRVEEIIQQKKEEYDKIILGKTLDMCNGCISYPININRKEACRGSVPGKEFFKSCDKWWENLNKAQLDTFSDFYAEFPIETWEIKQQKLKAEKKELRRQNRLEKKLAKQAIAV